MNRLISTLLAILLLSPALSASDYRIPVVPVEFSDVVPILADFTPESAAFLTNHSESVILFTNEDKWKKMDPKQMPLVRLVVDIDSWKAVYAATEADKAAYDKMDELYDAKWPEGLKPENVQFPTDNWDNLSPWNEDSCTFRSNP